MIIFRLSFNDFCLTILTLVIRGVLFIFRFVVLTLVNHGLLFFFCWTVLTVAATLLLTVIWVVIAATATLEEEEVEAGEACTTCLPTLHQEVLLLRVFRCVLASL